MTWLAPAALILAIIMGFVECGTTTVALCPNDLAATTHANPALPPLEA
jgi:hypothetical protein